MYRSPLHVLLNVLSTYLVPATSSKVNSCQLHRRISWQKRSRTGTAVSELKGPRNRIENRRFGCVILIDAKLHALHTPYVLCGELFLVHSITLISYRKRLVRCWPGRSVLGNSPCTWHSLTLGSTPCVRVTRAEWRLICCASVTETRKQIMPFPAPKGLSTSFAAVDRFMYGIVKFSQKPCRHIHQQFSVLL